VPATAGWCGLRRPRTHQPPPAGSPRASWSVADDVARVELVARVHENRSAHHRDASPCAPPKREAGQQPTVAGPPRLHDPARVDGIYHAIRDGDGAEVLGPVARGYPQPAAPRVESEDLAVVRLAVNTLSVERRGGDRLRIDAA